jgi:hypothetical protein
VCGGAPRQVEPVLRLPPVRRLMYIGCGVHLLIVVGGVHLLIVVAAKAPAIPGTPSPTSDRDMELEGQRRRARAELTL